MQGLAVKSVPVNFPLIDTLSAVKELKESSSNAWVKNFVVPKNAGGVTDGLIGMTLFTLSLFTHCLQGSHCTEANLQTITLD